MRALLACLIAAGCNGDCIDGVCPDLEQTVARPGPCESALDGFGQVNHCTYTYDADRVTSITCPWHETGTDPEHGEDTTTFTYDSAGEPLTIDSNHVDFDEGLVDREEVWTFDAQKVTLAKGGFSGAPRPVAVYDRATFAFLPMVGSFAMFPSAELGLESEGSITYTWTTSGTTLTRTSSSGIVETFELDDAGRIVHSPNLDYTFDGDLLIERSFSDGSQIETFQYDRGGNLATWDAASARETYEYSCW